MSMRDNLYTYLFGNWDDHFLIVSSFGLGDTYALAGLMHAFQRMMHPTECYLLVKKAHAPMARLFKGVKVKEIEDHMIHHQGECGELQQGKAFFAHPKFVKSKALPFGNVSDVVMYATILELPSRTPLTLPNWYSKRPEALEHAKRMEVNPGKTVLLIPDANSWPAPSISFWHLLRDSLLQKGWTVIWNTPNIPLDCVPAFVEECGWVIGSNSGMMQYLTLARVPARKTILTQSPFLGETGVFDGSGKAIPYTCVYGFRKCDGRLYDIEEFRIDGPQDHQEVVRLIMTGRNATGPLPNPAPMHLYELPTTPGEIIDALTIMRIKREKLPEKAHLMYREIVFYTEIRDSLVLVHPEIRVYEDRLLELNRVAWNNNQILIDTYEDPNYPDPDGDTPDQNWNVIEAFGLAHRANQQRVRIKNRINEICGVYGREQKSYNVGEET